MSFKIIASLALTVFLIETVFASMESKQNLIKAVQDKVSYDSVEPDNVTVLFGIAFQCANYDPQTQILKTKAWERYVWNDPRVTWNPSEYNNVEVVRLPAWRLWQPDILLYNSIKTEHRAYVNALVYSDGTILWVPPVTYSSYCSPSSDGSSPQCTLKFGSWTYDGTMLNIKKFEDSNAGSDADHAAIDNSADLSEYDTTACPYRITNLQATRNVQIYGCCPEPYIDITFTFNVEPNNS